jgi:hypothetical protein
MRVPRLPIAAVAALVFITRIATLPLTYWQGEEIRFARALLTFDPLQQQPEPPGYPLYVAIGRLFNFFVHDPFVALLALSVIAATAGAYLTALAVAEIFGSDWTGAAAALVLYFSPAMLVFDALPNPEALAMAFIAAAVLALVLDRTIWFSIAAAAAVAVLPQIALAMLVMVIVSVWVRASARTARAEAGAHTAGVILLAFAFIPLLEAIGVSNLVPYAKTNYVALRTSSAAAGLHGRELLLRFIAHSWGMKWISFPLLVAASIGFVILVRRSRRLAVTLAAFAIAHILFCLAFADRGDGVQPVIPSLIVIAIFAVAAAPRFAMIGAVLYAIGGFAYAWPIVHLRHTTPSAPARAMRFARRWLPHEAVLLYEPSMEAWTPLSRFETAPVRDFDRYADEPETMLFLIADGDSRTPHAVRFEWPDSDAYGKVTTERYRVVSVIPYPPASRYRSLHGVYAFERTGDGREWRWLSGDALIALPRLGKRVVQLKLALPNDAPVESNTILINGNAVTVDRGREVTVAFPASSLLQIRAPRTFISPRDQRALAVQLVALEQR